MSTTQTRHQQQELKEDMEFFLDRRNAIKDELKRLEGELKLLDQAHGENPTDRKLLTKASKLADDLHMAVRALRS